MSSCGGTCGITRERERHRALARLAAATPDPTHPLDDAELHRFASACAEALPARPVWVEGEGARWLYLVATTDDRSWVETRDTGDANPASPDETALRVGFSRVGRFATLQECRLHGEAHDDGAWIEETHLAGVEDPRLQTFVKATQGLLRKMKWVTLDAAFLAELTDDGDTLWSRLFDPSPMRETVGVWAPRSELERDPPLHHGPAL